MKKTTSKTKPLTKELSSNEVENIEPNTITIVVLITPLISMPTVDLIGMCIVALLINMGDV